MMGRRRVSTFVLFTCGIFVNAPRRSAPGVVLSFHALADQRRQAVVGLFVVVRYWPASSALYAHVGVVPSLGEELPKTRLRCRRAGRPSSILQWNIDLLIRQRDKWDV